MNGIVFPAPPSPRYPGGCSLEPAIFALDFLVNWRADVRTGNVTHRDANVLALLRDVLREPSGYGVSAQEAEAAKARFLDLGGALLEGEGGRRAWLEREFER